MKYWSVGLAALFFVLVLLPVLHRRQRVLRTLLDFVVITRVPWEVFFPLQLKSQSLLSLMPEPIRGTCRLIRNRSRK
jgi:hypothetical protein